MARGHKPTPDLSFESGAEFEEWLLATIESHTHGFSLTLASEAYAGYNVVLTTPGGWKTRILLKDGGVQRAWEIIADRLNAQSDVNRTIRRWLSHLEAGSILIVRTRAGTLKVHFHQGELHP